MKTNLLVIALLFVGVFGSVHYHVPEIDDEELFDKTSMILPTMPFAYAGCAATIIPQPCFDSFMGSHEPLTEDIIMKNLARNLETNYGHWVPVDRNWDFEDESLDLPAIICTEYIVDGSKQYRMAQWVDSYRISSWENHYNPLMCDRWLPPIDDGIKITWDKKSYPADRQGIVTVIDYSMNKNPNEDEYFEIKVHSDIDHTGISLTVTETDLDSGTFEGMVFFSPTGKSSGSLLLVEDAVYAKHAGNSAKSKITIVENSFDNSQISFSNSDLQRHIDKCDPLLHKETLPDITIETETEWYDLQYCMWRPHYPDVSNIDNCVDLFDALYAFHNAPKPNCGVQRYNEDGTPRGICEPEPYLSGMYSDKNLINSNCTENYSEWAYKTDANDMVFYVFEEMEKYQNWQLKRVLDRCEENNPNRSIKSFENYTHYIDSGSCQWNLKEISEKVQAAPLCVDENTILKDGVCQKIVIDPQPSDFRESGGNISLLYAYSGLGLVGIVVGFLIIKKWRKRK